jgi:hypothetical protein
MPLEKQKKWITGKLSNIEDDSLRQTLKKIFIDLIQDTDNELEMMRKNVEGGLQAMKQNLNPSLHLPIYQSWCIENDDLPQGFFPMPDFLEQSYTYRRRTDDSFEITTRMENQEIKIPILVIKDWSIESLKNKVRIYSDNGEVPYEIIKNENLLQQQLKMLDDLYRVNHLNWIPPFLPYSMRIYSLQIRLNFIKENYDKNFIFKIDQTEDISDALVLFPKLLWNIEKKEKTAPRTKTVYYGSKPVFTYNLDDIPASSKVLLAGKYLNIDEQIDYEVQGKKLNTITIENEEEHDYNYYLLHSGIEKNKQIIQSNELKMNHLLPAFTIRTKADIEAYFNAFAGISELNLIDIQIDESEMAQMPQERYYQTLGELEPRLRKSLFLRVSGNENDKFLKEKLQYLTFLMEQRLNNYWCTGVLVND